MAARWLPRLCVWIFIGGIAGLIIASVKGNNNGLVLVIGGVTTLAAITLLIVAALRTGQQIDVFDEARAERLEQRVATLVRSGADEDEVRALIRDAWRIRAR